MRHCAFYFAPLALAVLAVGILLEILRYPHWSAVACVVTLPIQITVLTVLVMVGGSDSGEGGHENEGRGWNPLMFPGFGKQRFAAI